MPDAEKKAKAEEKEAVEGADERSDEPRRLNWSTLKNIAVSPKALQYRLRHPRPDSDALRLGRAIHCLVFEPEEFGSRWISVGRCEATKKGGEPCGSAGSLYHDGRWFCRVRGHAPEGAGDPPDGIEVLGDDALALARTCVDSLKSHKTAWDLLKAGFPEQELEWTHKETGIACRGRVDLLGYKAIVDLKSTRRETIREIVMDASRMLYYAQVAWYHDGAIAADRLPKDAELPYLVAVSTVEPYDVFPFQLSRVAYEAGQIAYRDLILKYKRCLDSDWWPGAAPDLEVLDLPPWSLGMQGSEEGTGENW